MSRSFIFLLLPVFLFNFACNAKLYRNEMQQDVEGLKQSTRDIDDRYNSKFEILSDKINKAARDLDETEKTVNQNRADTDVMLQDLRVEMQGLQGKVEEAEHKLALIEKHLNKSTSDIDGRVVELENKFDIILGHLSRLQSILTGENKKTKQSLNSSDISEYDSLVKLITIKKNFDAGAKGMRKFLLKYPSSSLADNAQYWLAECYYARGNYSKAASEFAALTKKYPESEKKCGALLKQSFSIARLNKKEESRELLKSVVKQCPDTTEAKMALEKLASSKPNEAPPFKTID